jgi:hypothetical protein
MKDRITRYMALIILGITFLMMLHAGCTPKQNSKRVKKQLNELIKLNPDLVTSDTLHKDTTLVMPGIKDTATVKNDSAATFSQVDSLTGKFAGKVDSTALDSLNKGFKGILNKAITKDTIIRTKKGTKVHIHESPTGMQVDIETDSLKKDFKYDTAITTVKPVQVLTWWEEWLLKIGKETITVIGILLLFLIAYILYRILRFK